MAATISEQRYGPTTGEGTGWFGLAVCVVGAVAALADPSPSRVRIALALAILAVLTWCYLLRPRVIVRGEARLLLRNAFSTWEIPLAAITVVKIRALTRVTAGGSTYDGLGVGRRVRKMVRGSQEPVGYRDPALPAPERTQHHLSRLGTPEAVADLVTEQVLAAAQRARESGQDETPVRRHWAWTELTLLLVMAVTFVVAFLAG